jgi:hypothetical protein
MTGGDLKIGVLPAGDVVPALALDPDTNGTLDGGHRYHYGNLGTLVFVNLQAAFLSPRVAMSAFYLKGVSPPHVTRNEIVSGMLPYLLVIIVCMVIMYVWPGMTLWLANYLHGG